MWNERPMSALMLTPSRRAERDRLVDRFALVRRLRPDDVLHARREEDDLLGERVVEHPAGHDGHVLHAAIAAGELHADADVPGVDARRRLAAEHQHADADEQRRWRSAAPSGRRPRNRSRPFAPWKTKRIRSGRDRLAVPMPSDARFLRGVAAGFIAVAVIATAACSSLAFAPGRSGTVRFWVLAWPYRCPGCGRRGVGASRGSLARVALADVGRLHARGARARRGALRHRVGGHASPRSGRLARGRYGSFRSTDRSAIRASLQAHAPVVALAVAVAALAEEIVWRGVVTQLLAERVGSRVAWVWAAGLYALAFVPTAWALRAAERPESAARDRRSGRGTLLGSARTRVRKARAEHPRARAVRLGGPHDVPLLGKASLTRRRAFFADTFASPASGVVAVQEYGSSPRHRARSVSTKTARLLDLVLRASASGGRATASGGRATASDGRATALARPTTALGARATASVARATAPVSRATASVSRATASVARATASVSGPSALAARASPFARRTSVLVAQTTALARPPGTLVARPTALGGPPSALAARESARARAASPRDLEGGRFSSRPSDAADGARSRTPVRRRPPTPGSRRYRRKTPAF